MGCELGEFLALCGCNVLELRVCDDVAHVSSRAVVVGAVVDGGHGVDPGAGLWAGRDTRFLLEFCRVPGGSQVLLPKLEPDRIARQRQNMSVAHIESWRLPACHQI